MFTYSTIPNSTMILRSDGIYIPPDMGNRDYQEYLLWIADGNTAPSSLTLEQAQQAQIGLLNQSYEAACAGSVNYTSQGGVAKVYQADAKSIANLSQMLLAFSLSQTVPPGFYWIALDNTQVPFTYADMQGLAAVFGIQGAGAFVKFQILKSQVNSATSISSVQAVVW